MPINEKDTNGRSTADPAFAGQKLDEIKRGIDTLLNELPERIGEEFRAALSTAGAEGIAAGKSDSGKSGEKKGLGEARAEARNIESIIDNAGELSKEFFSLRSNMQLLTNLIKFSVVKDIQSLKSATFQWLQDFFSGNKGYDAMLKRFQTNLDYTQSGLSSTIDSLLNDLFRKGSVRMRDTVEAIRKDLEAGGKAFALAGLSTEEYGEALKRARAGVNAQSNMMSTMDFRQQNQFLQGIYEELVASGVDRKLDGDSTINMASRQYRLFEQIARNTGRTVEELIKNKRIEVEELTARGALNAQQAAELKAGLAYLPDELQQAVLKGFQYGSAELASSVQGTLKQDITSGQTVFVNQIMDAVRSGQTLNKQLIGQIAQSSKGQAVDVDPMVTYLLGWGNQQISNMNRLITQGQTKDHQSRNDFLERMYREFKEFFNENPWLQAGIEVASLVSGLTLWTVMIAKNIAALTANTLAIRSSTAGAMANTGPGFGSMAGKAGRILGKVARFGAMAAGTFAIIEGIYSFFTITNDEWNAKIGDKFSDAGAMAGRIGQLVGKIAAGLGTLAGFFFGGPIGWIVGAISGLVLAVDAFTDGAATQKLGELAAWLTDTDLGKIMSESLERVWNWLKDAVARIKSWFPFNGSSEQAIANSGTVGTPFDNRAAIDELKRRQEEAAKATSDAQKNVGVLASINDKIASVMKQLVDLQERNVVATEKVASNTRPVPSMDFSD